MDGIFNATRIWFCDMCDETITFSIRLRHFNSKAYINKKEYGNVVKVYEYSTPEIDEKNYIVKDATKPCRNKYFHSFEYRCVFDINFINMENNEEVSLTIIIGYVKFKSQFYWLKFKNQKGVEIWISF